MTHADVALIGVALYNTGTHAVSAEDKLRVLNRMLRLCGDLGEQEEELTPDEHACMVTALYTAAGAADAMVKLHPALAEYSAELAGKTMELANKLSVASAVRVVKQPLPDVGRKYPDTGDAGENERLRKLSTTTVKTGTFAWALTRMESGAKMRVSTWNENSYVYVDFALAQLRIRENPSIRNCNSLQTDTVWVPTGLLRMDWEEYTPGR